MFFKLFIFSQLFLIGLTRFISNSNGFPSIGMPSFPNVGNSNNKQNGGGFGFSLDGSDISPGDHGGFSGGQGGQGGFIGGQGGQGGMPGMPGGQGGQGGMPGMPGGQGGQGGMPNRG